MLLPEDASPDDIWIAVLGPSGVGKSSLIKSLTRNEFIQDYPRRHNLFRETSTLLSVSRLTLDRRIWLIEVDPSGIFDGMPRNPVRELAIDLNQLYLAGIKLSAVLWLHRITDVRLRGSQRESLSLLNNIVGQGALSAVHVITTFWNRESSETAEARLRQLADFWFEPIMKAGGTIHRFDDPVDAEGAYGILQRILTHAKPVTLQIQTEMTIKHLSFEQTSVYRGLLDLTSPATSVFHPNDLYPPYSQPLIPPIIEGSSEGIRNQAYDGSTLVTSSRDIIIAVMGVTGAGKSSFIQYLTDQVVPVSSGLESFTENITIYRCSLPDTPKFFLIDTPGFDDTNRSDLDILEQLADFLVTIWDSKIKLTGIIYLESIMEVGSGRAPDRHIAMFRHLCGEHTFANVALVTTFWDVTTQDRGRDDMLKYDTEEKLRNDPEHWAGMVKKGSRMFRHRNSKATAVRVVKYLIQKQNQVVLTLQEELGAEGKALPETAAGTVVAEQLRLLKNAHERQIQDIRKEIRKALEERDTIWQQRLEEMKRQHEADIERQIRSGRSISSTAAEKPHTNLSYGTSNISGQANAVLGSVYKSEHKTYQIQNATFVFENQGRYRALKHSRRGYNDPSEDREEIKSVLREFLGHDENPSRTKSARTNLNHSYQTSAPLLPYDSYDYS